MLINYVANAESEAVGLLDWIILTGFSLSVGGAVTYRLLAAWKGWWTDK
ncbi:hypothetical protein [Arthrobacter bambusae]|nr:hypothetical protein [Arthrobacter bambusae]MDQ0031465.1 hypothetical protein [Arthrobacter bambusae]MDQ0099647.1 hypothetical protein [Arthrobacter bambusae]